MQYLDQEEAKKMVSEEGYTVVDIRDGSQYDRSHIAKSVHVPLFIANEDMDPGITNCTCPLIRSISAFVDTCLMCSECASPLDKNCLLAVFMALFPHFEIYFMNQGMQKGVPHLSKRFF